MKQTNQNLIAVTGNVYYCKFREVSDPDVLRAGVLSVAHDIRRAVNSMQTALREVREVAVRLEGTDANAAFALRELADTVGEIAFHSHFAALDCERGTAPLELAQEMRQLARGGVAVAGDLREWGTQSLGRTHDSMRFLMDIAARVHAAAHALQNKVSQHEDPAQRPN